jgi:hypothetical protein
MTIQGNEEGSLEPAVLQDSEESKIKKLMTVV